MKISVIIPCFNEKSSLNLLLKTIDSCSLVSEIIIVDDGSILPVASFLRPYKKLKIITHPHNLGKSQALKTGLTASIGDIVVLIDGDLIGMDVNHLVRLISPVKDHLYDICIGEFYDQFRLFNYVGLTIMLSGIRVYRRQMLLENLFLFENTGFINGYLVEVKSNQIFFNSSYRIAKTKLPNLTQNYKWQKNNFVMGAINDYKIMKNIFIYLGPTKFYRQLRFCQHLPHSP